ncbi:MAG: hypothetical protein Q8765_02395 [Sweet potato little leaf phytoplasma]|nr:hypothetical protein [Sweet potato little leaf phytoplasma]
MDLDRANAEYWDALLVVCSWEAQTKKEKEAPKAKDNGGGDSSFAEEKMLFQGKTHAELEALQGIIESDMRAGTALVVEYWEAILKHLHVFKAKAYLNEIHAGQMLLKQRPCKRRRLDLNTTSSHPVAKDDDEEDKATLELKPMAAALLQHEEDNLEMKEVLKIMGHMEDGDAIFGSGAEVKLHPQQLHSCLCHDNYKPRKPKYFNRCHTRYIWNRYNRVHYDHENPPPKVITGYKFNIFYPHLLDKTKSPIYTIEKDDSNGETCTIRFHAGAPYEDIAFQIVNKEWELSRKKGFKSVFYNGILSVYFNFKQVHYRR